MSIALEFDIVHVKNNLVAPQRKYRKRNFRVDDLVKDNECL
jgi:hypothetical protein